MDVIPFPFDGKDLRFGTTEGGRVFVVAKDFTGIMGYTQPSDAVRLLDNDEYALHEVLSRSSNNVDQSREMLVIFEEGIWELIFRSNLPAAKEIKRHVKRILREMRESHQGGIFDFIRSSPRTYTPVYPPEVRAFIRSSNWTEPEFYNYLYNNALLPEEAMDTIKKNLSRRYLFGRYRWVWTEQPNKEVMLHQFLRERGLELNTMALGQILGIMHVVGKDKERVCELFQASKHLAIGTR